MTGIPTAKCAVIVRNQLDTKRSTYTSLIRNSDNRNKAIWGLVNHDNADTTY